jgi:hypothetical protein
MHDNDDSDPDIGGGAFVCAASLPAQGLSLARLASAFRPKNSEPAADAAVARAVAAAVAAWSSAPNKNHSTNGNSKDERDDRAHASDCRLVCAGSSTLTTSGGSSSPIETFTHSHAGLALRPKVCDCIHLCPILGAPVTSSTLARVVPYALATRSCFVAIAGTIDNAADLERRFAPRLAASSSSALRGAQSMPPLPSFEAARDEALANEVACLSLTPPGGGGMTVGSPSSSRTRSAALSGVRRAVDAGQAAARAVLALVEDAVAGSGARAAESPAQALTLALTEIQGSFALALHDAERGFTLAARDASGEEELWFCLTPDAVVFASPCPIDLGAASASSPRAASGWHPLPAGHFVVCGGGFGRQPRLHQYALTPEQLSVRAASHEHEQAPRSRSKRDGGVSLSSAASFDAAHGGASAAAAFAPVSPHSSSFDDIFHE